MLEIPTAVKMIAGALPFMVIADKPQYVNKTRVLEAVVIGLITGTMIALAGVLIALPVIKEQLGNLQKDIARVEATQAANADSIKILVDRLDKQIDEIRRDITKVQVDQARGR